MEEFMEPVSLWLWLGFTIFILALLAFDLGILHREKREIGVKEALWLSLLYIVIALIFSAGVFYYRGTQQGYEFLTGYVIEKSLSLDNIFVILLIFTHFQVPPAYQHRVLFWGIIGALIMRAVLILAGVALLDAFEWVVYIFGAFLILTGIKMLLAVDAKPDMENNKVIALARKYLRVTPDYEGPWFFVRKDGLRYATPLFLVLILVETTDLIFAVDSIPAIFAITRDPFIVYSSNVFAILGLRALYFALAGVITKFYYLKYALSLVLIVVGAKMILNAIYDAKVLPVEWALLITAVLIGGSIVLSLILNKGEMPGTWVPGSPNVPQNKNKPQGSDGRSNRG
jgi:tellurite resistance protein TerC